MTKRYFYSAESAHGTSTSRGFANDWVVKVWDSKKARDTYVERVANITAIAIPRNQATKKATNWDLTRNEYHSPKPFSGEYWGIETYMVDDNSPVGFIGELSVGDDSCELQRFY